MCVQVLIGVRESAKCAVAGVRARAGGGGVGMVCGRSGFFMHAVWELLLGGAGVCVGNGGGHAEDRGLFENGV